ncbi:SDR family oxidoreductase [Mesorhizobium sp. B2-4-19]|uniref:SDR family NAD(P)-dependent oxidoreductase n=1 Tax=Mesorhizobium sp. B2-4-19 TaxID=2589930 RepID=UPI0015E31BE9|nr:SDR family oxidoreductase [Mesorhizobium sp. B2-4-19]
MNTTSNILPEGHVAVVIGGGGAIGAACVRAFAEAGATVWSVDLHEQAAAGALTGLLGAHRAAACDVTDPASAEALAGLVGKADSVVYAAGLNADGNVVDIDWSAYRKVMAVNLDGAFHIGAAFARRMSARGGALVFLSSTAGLRGEAGASIYCASKFGLIGFVESMAAELAGERIRVNAVCPGNVDSPMLREVAHRIAERTGADAGEIWRGMAHSGAARRLVTPAEVAALCLHLASPASAAITGTTVRIDAGAMLSA